MGNWVSRVWHDPVWSKVIAAEIVIGIAALVAWLRTNRSFSPLYYIIAILAAITVVAVGVAVGTRLDLRRQAARRPAPVLPNVTLTPIDSVILEGADPNSSFPLRCQVRFRNDSKICVDIRILHYTPKKVTLREMVFSTLQLDLGDWYPDKLKQADRVAAFPGQFVRAWVALDHEKYDARYVNSQKGELGWLVLEVSGVEKIYPL